MDLTEEKIEGIRRALAQEGYCVVPSVVSESDCDEHMDKYKAWLAQFPEPSSVKHRMSIIKDYSLGHSDMAWSVRLAARPVFAALWDTDKLLTSMDSVAIAQPPTQPDHFDREKNWLHCDQSWLRQGLHAYQGAVYLEAATQHDYCLRVMAKSHNCHQLFFSTFPRARTKSAEKEFFRLNKTHVKWYEQQGCNLTCVAVPKGGMVLWDSRTIHDNRPPTHTRPDPHRWRFVTFVCMTPAVWASDRDYEKKREAYTELHLTNHWASQKMRLVRNSAPAHQRHLCVDTLGDVAKSALALKLAGVEKYDFSDGESNGPSLPLWVQTK